VLTRSPRGPVRKGLRYPRAPYAGRFTVLEANGFARRAGVSFNSRYRFGADRIDIAWRASRGRSDVLSAEVLFPSWESATINAVLKTGDVRKLAAPPAGQASVLLAAVNYFFIDGSEGGYVVLPRAIPAGALAYVLNPSKQSSNPRPGPSLAVRLAPASTWRAVSFGVTIAPARTAADAAAIVAQLAGESASPG
jgi:hypothetical protein